MLRAVALLAVLLLAACGQATGGGPGAGKPADLPAASLDGVDGAAVSYCWRTVCADGFPTPSAPRARTVRAVQIGVPTSRVEAVVRRGPVTGFQQSSVAASSEGRLGPIPGGQWDYLLVMVNFREGGGAMYAWRLR